MIFNVMRKYCYREVVAMSVSSVSSSSVLWEEYLEKQRQLAQSKKMADGTQAGAVKAASFEADLEPKGLVEGLRDSRDDTETLKAKTAKMAGTKINFWDTSQSESQNSADELLSSVAGNLSKRLAAAYTQGQNLYSSVSLSA
jgi:hypothetical protein